MIFLRNNLATYEIHVSMYYLERRAYIAALNRARYVVENFQGSPAVAEAVSIMAECYLRLGLDDLADTSIALLKTNFPDHPTLDSRGNFIVRDHVTNPSLLYTVSFGLLGSNADNTPLAPTTRPNPSIAPQSASLNTGRSLLNILSMGRFGNNGPVVRPDDVPPVSPTDELPVSPTDELPQQ